MMTQQNILEYYQKTWQNYFNPQADWLSILRKKQFDQFIDKGGFPTTSDEMWKYTHLTSFRQHFFEFVPIRKCANIANIQSFLFEQETFQLVFVDGHFQEHLSRVPNPDQLIITNLAQALQEHEDLLCEYLAKQQLNSAFALLNTACMQDGVFIYVPKNVEIKQPVHLLFLSSNNNTKSLQTIRNFFIFDENAQAVIFEEHVSVNQNPYVANIYTQFYAKCNSKVNYIKLQNQHLNSFHFANLEIMQKQNSQINASIYHLGSEIAREDVHAHLEEQGASFYLNSLYLPFNKQHIDLHTYIHHLADHTESEECVKGIVASQSRAVFNGKILVGKNIKKAVANLQNKNLLLGNNAEINSKPELEIYSDDVKCKHGATIGELDHQMLFYLRSRGIQQREAYQLLLLAFIHEQLAIISNPIISEKLLLSVTKHCEEVMRCSV